MYMLNTWGSKSVSLTLAFTGWDTISSFNGRGKKNCLEYVGSIS